MQSAERTRTKSTPFDRDRTYYPDWIRASILSGFIATFAMTCMLAIGYGIANGAGDASGGTFQRWMFNLSENEITRNVGDRFLIIMIANLVAGVLWAMFYARYFEPVIPGSGPQKGIIFSLIPWLLSIVLFLPAAGAGFLGMSLDAGPLPVIGNLILHLVYGAVLGSLYAIGVEAGLDGTRGERDTAVRAERGAAIGLLIGAVTGGIGGWLVSGQMENLASSPVIALAGVLSGAAIGTLIGSFTGMTEQPAPAKSSTEELAPVARKF